MTDQLEFKNVILLEKLSQQENLTQISSNFTDSQSLREVTILLTQIVTFKWNRDYLLNQSPSIAF